MMLMGNERKVDDDSSSEKDYLQAYRPRVFELSLEL